jgi:hypothetical protein
MFQDPVDIFDWFEGNLELPFGTPYPIEHDCTITIP